MKVPYLKCSIWNSNAKSYSLSDSPLLPFYGGNARIRFRLDCQNSKDESNSIYFPGFFHFAIRTLYVCTKCIYVYHFICRIHEIEIIKLGTTLRLSSGLDIFHISGFTLIHSESNSFHIQYYLVSTKLTTRSLRLIMILLVKTQTILSKIE